MASSSSSRSLASYSCEKRPRLLKDFLSDDSAPSCSSSKLLRSRSRASSISISALHKASEMVINAIKFLPFASAVKSSHSILPRSLSRKLSRSKHNPPAVAEAAEEVSVVVTPKIKDILRWKSFRDVVEELPASWNERDSTAEDLPSWGDENSEFLDQNSKMEGQFSIDENGQHSPVSVLDNSPFNEDGGSFSFFNRSIDVMGRRKCILMQRIEEFESLAKLETFNQEEGFPSKESSTDKKELHGEADALYSKAMQLLSQVKATYSSFKKLEADEEHLLLDFFIHELAIISSKKQKDVESADCELLRLAKSWTSREYCDGIFDWEKTEASSRDVEGGDRWDKFDEEQQELGRELEIHVLNDLLDELLADLVIQLNSAQQF